MIPNPIRLYAEIADLDFMMFSPQDEFMQDPEDTRSGARAPIGFRHLA
jgi:hypothetical protein